MDTHPRQATNASGVCISKPVAFGGPIAGGSKWRSNPPRTQPMTQFVADESHLIGRIICMVSSIFLASEWVLLGLAPRRISCHGSKKQQIGVERGGRSWFLHSPYAGDRRSDHQDPTDYVSKQYGCGIKRATSHTDPPTADPLSRGAATDWRLSHSHGLCLSWVTHKADPSSHTHELSARNAGCTDKNA